MAHRTFAGRRALYLTDQLIEGQVVRTTDVEHRPAESGIEQRKVDEASYIFCGVEVDGIVAAAEHRRLALFDNWLTDNLGPELHEWVGTHDDPVERASPDGVLGAKLHARELHRVVRCGAMHRDE